VTRLNDVESDPIGDPFEDEISEPTGDEQTPEREVEEPVILLKDLLETGTGVRGRGLRGVIDRLLCERSSEEGKKERATEYLQERVWSPKISCLR
jgi:hypothetical protein